MNKYHLFYKKVSINAIVVVTKDEKNSRNVFYYLDIFDVYNKTATKY
jgi:hypothetical protein